MGRGYSYTDVQELQQIIDDGYVIEKVIQIAMNAVAGKRTERLIVIYSDNR